jgi:hypothetical protein
MLCSAMRLPQGLCGNPSHQHDTQPCDRTDQSEHQAIVCMLGNRIHMLFHIAPNWRNDSTKRPLSEPNPVVGIAVFFVYLFKLDYRMPK